MSRLERDKLTVEDLLRARIHLALSQFGMQKVEPSHSQVHGVPLAKKTVGVSDSVIADIKLLSDAIRKSAPSSTLVDNKSLASLFKRLEQRKIRLLTPDEIYHNLPSLSVTRTPQTGLVYLGLGHQDPDKGEMGIVIFRITKGEKLNRLEEKTICNVNFDGQILINQKTYLSSSVVEILGINKPGILINSSSLSN